MKRGVVLELINGRATVLDTGGGFRSLTAHPGWQVGDVVPLPMAQRWMAAAAFLALALCLGAWAGLWFPQTALVSLDINPSIELGLNRFGRVVSTRGLGEEGLEVLSQVKLRGKTCDQAVSALLDGGSLAPYLEENTRIMLTVQSDTASREEELLALVRQTAADTAASRAGASVECHGVDGTLVAEAHSHGVTAGKYLALLELQEADPEVDISTFAHCGIGEILQETARCQQGSTQESQPYEACNRGNGYGGHHGKAHHSQ